MTEREEHLAVLLEVANRRIEQLEATLRTIRAIARDEVPE